MHFDWLSILPFNISAIVLFSTSFNKFPFFEALLTFQIVFALQKTKPRFPKKSKIAQVFKPSDVSFQFTLMIPNLLKAVKVKLKLVAFHQKPQIE